jgi:hypothetical protein
MLGYKLYACGVCEEIKTSSDPSSSNRRPMSIDDADVRSASLKNSEQVGKVRDLLNMGSNDFFGPLRVFAERGEEDVLQLPALIRRFFALSSVSLRQGVLHMVRCWSWGVEECKFFEDRIETSFLVGPIGLLYISDEIESDPERGADTTYLGRKAK